MKIYFSNPSFYGKPQNYSVIDKYVSRSAQPKEEDLAWLKEQGVTDILNFRTMYQPGIDYDEESVAKELGMKYHSIPSVTAEPQEKSVNMFLKKIESIKKQGGRIHIHCYAGADRTGMYAFIYKTLNGIGTLDKNKKEWLAKGHNYNKYPDLISWAENFVKKHLKK